MSWHYSQALVAAYSAATCSDGAPSAPSSTTATPEAYSSHDKTTERLSRSRSGMMSAPLTDEHGEAVLTWFLEGSHARTSPQQEKERESLGNGQDSGPKWLALSVRFDPASCGWKTVRCCGEKDSDWSSLTLPKWGSLHDGELWERTTPALPTSATGSGCWVGTPTAAMSRRSEKFRGLKKLPTPAELVRWPTPMAQDAKHSGYAPSGPGKRDKLAYAVVMANWPTPKASDAKVRRITDKWRGEDLGSQVTAEEEANGREMPKAGGKLNPMWVEWLMGWPLGWTDCAASAMDKYQQWCDSHGRR